MTDWRPIAELPEDSQAHYDILCRRWNEVVGHWEWRRFTDCWKNPRQRPAWRCLSGGMERGGWQPMWWTEVTLPAEVKAHGAPV